jgi:hypothetical protein
MIDSGVKSPAAKKKKLNHRAILMKITIVRAMRKSIKKGLIIQNSIGCRKMLE